MPKVILRRKVIMVNNMIYALLKDRENLLNDKSVWFNEPKMKKQRR